VRVRRSDTDDENGTIVKCSGQDIAVKLDFNHEIRARFDSVVEQAD